MRLTPKTKALLDRYCAVPRGETDLPRTDRDLEELRSYATKRGLQAERGRLSRRLAALAYRHAANAYERAAKGAAIDLAAFYRAEASSLRQTARVLYSQR